MERQLIEFINGIKANKEIHSFDETSTKQAVVLRLLFLLGWDIFNVDEVNPNLAAETQHADYALSIKSARKIFIKVLKPKESLEKYQNKVFDYSSKKGIDFTILTNGLHWWFYLSNGKGSALQNRFAALDFLKQPVNEILEQMVAYLKRDEVARDVAVKKAADVLKTKLQQGAQKAIPEAWTQILSGPNETLVRLISDTVEKICGVPAERNAIVHFLNERLKSPHPVETAAAPLREVITPVVEEKVPVKVVLEEVLETVLEPPEITLVPEQKVIVKKEKTVQQSYDGHPISSFTLKGKSYKVTSWEQLLIKLCEVLKTEYLRDIDSLQWHAVGKKYYFNKNQDELRVPAVIGGTDLFVETYLNPNEVVKVAQSILNGFGFVGSDLVIS